MRQKTLLSALLASTLLVAPSCSDKNSTEPSAPIELTISGVFEDIGYIRIQVTYDGEMRGACSQFTSSCGIGWGARFQGTAEFSCDQDEGFVPEVLQFLSGETLGLTFLHFPEDQICSTPLADEDFLIHGVVQAVDFEDDIGEVRDIYFAFGYPGTLNSSGCPNPPGWEGARGYFVLTRKIGDTLERTTCANAALNISGVNMK